MANQRFPTPPNPNQNQSLAFPEDQKEFFVTFDFATYNIMGSTSGPLTKTMNAIFGDRTSDRAAALANTLADTAINPAQSRAALGAAAVAKIADLSKKNPAGSLILPIPKKINDATTLTWNEESLLSKALTLANSDTAKTAVGIAQAVSPFTGFALNPFLFMQFQRQNFKDFVFQWTFTPNSLQESAKVKEIIKMFQRAALPTNYGFVLKYPNVVDIKFYPDNLFGMFKMKTCAIVSVQVDYTGAGQPAFFKQQQFGITESGKGGAPVVMNLSVSLKEIELWDSTDIKDY